MKNRVLVIKQVPHESPGTIGPVLERAGFVLETVRPYRGDKVPRVPGPYAAVICLGGPMGVYEKNEYPFLGDEVRLLERCIKDHVPVMGICLGSQILARAAGADVYPGGAKEIGFYEVELTEEARGDRLLMGLPERPRVFQWHGDTFDLPPGAIRLATSSEYPNQAFRVGPSAYGFQFHFEVTAGMVREWLGVNTEELEGLPPESGIDPGEIAERAPEGVREMAPLGYAIARRFARLVEVEAGCG